MLDVELTPLLRVGQFSVFLAHDVLWADLHILTSMIEAPLLALLACVGIARVAADELVLASKTTLRNMSTALLVLAVHRPSLLVLRLNFRPSQDDLEVQIW